MIENFLLGTYTKRESEGIYEIALDTDKKELTDLTLLTKESGPTYLAKSDAGNLYTVTSIDGKGGITAYDASFNSLNSVTAEGASPCYVAVDEPRQLVYGANYHKGEITVYQINKDGSLTLTDSVIHTDEVGPHENQDHAHAHYADLTPDQRLVACDLGTDRVYTYDVSNEGKLTLVSTYKAEPGTGPRHITFHPTKPIAYLFGELDSTVTVLSYDETTGAFAQQQKISTLPEGYDAFNGGAAIRVSKDGRFVYASNRGHNSIALFSVNENGQLTFVERVASEGDIPRDFNFNQTEDFIICAHQNSDNLTLFARDADTGKLTVVQKNVYAPECVCVAFA
ncbi:lactonase family protein [Enterococcus bulliens]